MFINENKSDSRWYKIHDDIALSRYRTNGSDHLTPSIGNKMKNRNGEGSFDTKSFLEGSH